MGLHCACKNFAGLCEFPVILRCTGWLTTLAHSRSTLHAGSFRGVYHQRHDAGYVHVLQPNWGWPTDQLDHAMQRARYNTFGVSGFWRGALWSGPTACAVATLDYPVHWSDSCRGLMVLTSIPGQPCPSKISVRRREDQGREAGSNKPERYRDQGLETRTSHGSSKRYQDLAILPICSYIVCLSA